MKSNQVSFSTSTDQFSEYMHDVSNNFSNGILVIDSHGIVESFNPTFASMFPMKLNLPSEGEAFDTLLENILNEGLINLVDCTPTDWLTNVLFQVEEAPKSFQINLSNGKTVEINVNIFDGGRVCVFTDLSETIALEKTKAELWGNIEETLDSMENGICLFDKKLTVSMYNSYFFELLQLRDSLHNPTTPLSTILFTMAKRGDLGIGDPSDLANYHLSRITNREQDKFESLLPDNKVIELTITPSPRGGTVVSVMDITERKNAENQLRNNYNSLMSVIDAVPAMIEAKDTDNRYLFVNETFTKMCGKKRKSVIGKTSEEVFGQKAGRHMDILDRHLMTADATIMVFDENLSFAENIERTWHTQKVLSKANTSDATKLLTVRLDITDMKTVEHELHRAKLYDPLTGLPNRAKMMQYIDEKTSNISKNNNGSFTLIFIDIDEFTKINLSLGTANGDKILTEFARRLSPHLKHDDAIARTGGDEFTILLSNIDDKKEVECFTKDVIASLRKPITVDDHDILVDVSIGISIFPQHGRTRNQIVRAADMALRMSASMPNNHHLRYHFYQDQLSEELNERIKLETALRSANYDEQFEIHYQPQIGLRSGEITGLEALLRWNHPTLGRISPAVFIPIAEACGVIINLGQWVLDTVCKQLDEWQIAGVYSPRVAVNFSATQFQNASAFKNVELTLKNVRFDSQLLQIEITENIAMDDIENTVQKLSKLSDLGVGMSIDDFGTGYSSLGYLKQFSFNELKIDKSFVDDLPGDIGALSIARSIIALGHNLGMTVLAEGIENKQQRDCLLEAGCDEAQGYYYSRPLSATDYAVFSYSYTPLKQL